ncbi:Folate-dependent protein for Fe/S cluster synthesis/repair in oxidative stress [plant metagenome]|uniref:Folate-dependent protein for Fe/S cluster synthesis/repair in oxidative stress n=1 Tax=plant metagenome TaxID=1297885 RepID=A0A484Q8V7_9ZZZZ
MTLNTPFPAPTAAQREGAPNVYALDTDYAVLQAVGADALTFLQGQLTNDVAGLPADAARFGGYCTAKGRLLATMVYWRADTEEVPGVRLLVRRDLAEALVKRLGMFVLRAKVKLSLTELRVFGVEAPQTTALTEVSEAAGAQLPAQAWQRVDLDSGTWIAAPAAEGASPRWWWVAALDQLAGSAAALAASAAADAQAWKAADIAAGLPWIQASTQDVFIPQTVNLELVGGVSFTKGCYPGQEVVARSHYRGTVKRRMAYGVLAETPPAPAEAGVDVFDGEREDEPSGRIVDVAGGAVLFETPLAALETGHAPRVGAPDGPAITVTALPYAIVPQA